MTSRGWRSLLIAAAAVLLAFPVARASMAELHLFSAISGTVLDQGKPVAGAELSRTYNWAWKDTTATDTATTDAAGHFSFPAITASSILGSLLPHEPVITQHVRIRHGGADYQAWAFTKHNYRENGELGRPIRMTCRLEDPPTFHGEVFGICSID